MASLLWGHTWCGCLGIILSIACLVYITGWAPYGRSVWLVCVPSWFEWSFSGTYLSGLSLATLSWWPLTRSLLLWLPIPLRFPPHVATLLFFLYLLLTLFTVTLLVLMQACMCLLYCPPRLYPLYSLPSRPPTRRWERWHPPSDLHRLHAIQWLMQCSRTGWLPFWQLHHLAVRACVASVLLSGRVSVSLLCVAGWALWVVALHGKAKARGGEGGGVERHRHAGVHRRGHVRLHGGRLRPNRREAGAAVGLRVVRSPCLPEELWLLPLRLALRPPI